MGPMVTQDFTVPYVTTYLSMKVLLTFAKNEIIRFFLTIANLSYDQNC